MRFMKFIGSFNFNGKRKEHHKLHWIVIKKNWNFDSYSKFIVTSHVFKNSGKLLKEPVE